MMSMLRIMLIAVLCTLQSNSGVAFNSNHIRPQQSGAMKVKSNLGSLVVPKAPSTLASSSALHSIYASPGVVDSIDEKKFRPGPQISIGSLKLNWYGAIFGIIGVSLAFFWWSGLLLCQAFQFLTRQKFDSQRRLPVEVGHLWGTIVLKLTNCYPVITGKENLKAIYKGDSKTKEKKPVMFVANHSSFMDIYFVGVSIGWKNYKVSDMFH